MPRSHSNEFEKTRGKAIIESEYSTSDAKIPWYIYEANKHFFKDSPITVEEAKPFKVEAATFPVEYFTLSKASQINDKVKKLRNWKIEGKTISETKESLEWQEAFSNLLDEFDEWVKADDEEEIDLFHQKSLLYRILLSEASSIILNDRIVKKYLKLLNQREIQKEFVSEWYLEFNDLRKEINAIESNEQQKKLFDLLKNSNNSAIRIYLDLEKILKLEKTKSKLITTMLLNYKREIR